MKGSLTRGSIGRRRTVCRLWLHQGAAYQKHPRRVWRYRPALA